MTNKRLPPQPADTALARAARRLIDLLPLVTIGTQRATEEKLRSALARELEALRDAFEAKQNAHAIHREMRHMAQRFAAQNAIPRPRTDRLTCERDDNPLTGEIGHRLTVSFRTLCVQYRIPEYDIVDSREGADAAVKRHLQAAARKIAYAHAIDLEAEILAHALRMAGIEKAR